MAKIFQPNDKIGFGNINKIERVSGMDLEWTKHDISKYHYPDIDLEVEIVFNETKRKLLALKEKAIRKMDEDGKATHEIMQKE